jgi:hypothetical protein
MGILCAILHLWPAVSAVPEHRDAVLGTLRWLLANGEAADASGAPTGLYLSSLGGKALVHWCHGSTGAVFLWTKAAAVLEAGGVAGDGVFARAAVRAAEAVWHRGLLRKGPGLCHGVGGNGLALLHMFRVTGQRLWLYRAACFASFLVDAEFLTGARQPDSPGSLFEGLAGGLHLVTALLHAATPGTAPGDVPGFPLFVP